ncbi:bifunctional hydroxymethylpyrimidine kinase/phosphomethylpyrimidine kinase [Salinicoccus hispanicus]|uniref:pyridoxal kinase n=1 Tax=Salinicoccus hispanicus TaxID=157225 RepID=A0A6N8U4N3_9STAP|nr:bifunctional hydroxymethylpyrimidine kinase/phosphomethylpyrimidine kinase [Salinicoccus hispanicus]MXQ51435.1 bifunctional hydroxymethylpyrimidine kinase/phosphomethylpyrimidine kinase [Salinicoccus hispanicus]
MALKKTLTIAGSDTSGGAGIAADLKTFQEHETYGMTALTTIVTMDPETWSHGVNPIPLEVVDAQIETALSISPDAIKTGMLPSEEVIERSKHAFLNSEAKHFVVDPVMVCKGDDEVLNPGLVDAMIEHLLPHATVVTPNLFEAGQLAGYKTPTTLDAAKKCAEVIHAKGVQHVIIKGGSDIEGDKAVDVYYDGKAFHLLTSDKIDASYNHGAGCTFAAAITANLANGQEPLEAIQNAKAFVTSAIKNGWKMNDHVGVVRHGAFNAVEQIEVTDEQI